MASRPEVARLRALAGMGTGELRARANALPDLLAAIAGVMPLLDALPIGSADESRESSEEMVSLAQTIWNLEPRSTKTVKADDYNGLLADAKSLAGSVISQAPGPDADQEPLPLDDPATRSLIDAQVHGQSLPLERTTALGPDTTGPKGNE